MAIGNIAQGLEPTVCLAEGTVGLTVVSGNIGQILEDVVCLAEGSVFIEGEIDQVLEDVVCLAMGTVTMAPDVSAALMQTLEDVVCLANGTVTTPPPEDITWFDRYCQKKVESFFAINVLEAPPGDIIPDIEEFTTKNYHLANIPKHSIITDSYVYVTSPVLSTGAVLLELGTSEGSNDVLCGANLSLLGKQGLFFGDQLNKLQVPLYAEITNNGFPIPSSKGDFIIVVEYFEYKLNDGDYTALEDD